MTSLAKAFSRSAASQNARPKPPASPSHKTTRDCPRVTLRFSRDDYERLQELADGMALATYIRAIALNEKMPRRSRRSASSVADKEVQAQILGLLGQSRIANNLNQLAYQANVGTLVIDDETRVQIDEAYENVGIIRETLITALGNGRQ